MYCLIGKKLGHSYSKEIHESLNKENYNLIELDKLDSFFQEKHFKGCNVTIPYKKEVIKYCDYLSETATRTQSINSIVNIKGKLHGYNTDYDGLKYLIDYNDISIENKTIAILGNGSTSRTILILCKDLNAKKIFVYARNPNHDEEHLNDIENNQNINIIFNATPVGMYPNNANSLGINLNKYKNLDAVVDLIYNPHETEILKTARKLKIKSVNGLLMLIQQAVKSSEIFHQTIYSNDVTNEIYKNILFKTLNFVFIGMPMSGKSFFSKYISRKYGKEVVDIDNIIKKNENATIESIFKLKGEKYFRLLETNAIKEISKSHNLAISTGGGAILNEKNIDLLKQNGIIIFLDVPLSLLETFNPMNRPLLRDKSNLRKLYQDRNPLYKKYSDITVIKNSYDETETFGRIEAKINEYFNS
jgi:shikimate dehydrogenase